VMAMLASDELLRSLTQSVGQLVFVGVFLLVGILLIVYLCQSLGPLRRFEVERTRGHGFQPVLPPGTPPGVQPGMHPGPGSGLPQTVLPVYPPPERDQP
jgi:hypothetical protein